MERSQLRKGGVLEAYAAQVELAEELSGLGVGDPDVEFSDKDQDAPAGVLAAPPDVAQTGVVAQG